MRAAHDIGLTERLALIPSICILRSVGGMRFVANHVPGIDVPPETVRARRAGGRRRARVLRHRLRAGRPRAGPARRGRPALHLVPQGRGHREALRVASASPHESKESPMDTVLRSRSASVTIGADAAVLRHRRAHQPHRAQGVRRGAAQRGPLDRDRRRPGPGRGRRQHARRQRRHPAGGRARAAEGDAHDRPGGRRPADLHRLLGDRGARGGAVGLRGPGAGQLGDRRGRAPGRDPAAGGQARRRRDRAGQRRDRHPRDAGEAPGVRAQDRLAPPTTTGSPPRT